MKIFGKRPFVLKTGKMSEKIEAIKTIDGFEGVLDNANYIINEVKVLLEDIIISHMETYKDVQELASDVREIIEKEDLYDN